MEEIELVHGHVDGHEGAGSAHAGRAVDNHGTCRAPLRLVGPLDPLSDEVGKETDGLGAAGGAVVGPVQVVHVGHLKQALLLPVALQPHVKVSHRNISVTSVNYHTSRNKSVVGCGIGCIVIVFRLRIVVGCNSVGVSI